MSASSSSLRTLCVNDTPQGHRKTKMISCGAPGRCSKKLLSASTRRSLTFSQSALPHFGHGGFGSLRMVAKKRSTRIPGKRDLP
jgi:hypothetical protein